MDTECSGEQLQFHALGRRLVTGRFDGGRMSSDGGGLLLREVDQRIGLTERLASCFVDHRNPLSVEHDVRTLLAQRVYAMALGYEDLNDHDELRRDALLSAAGGQDGPDRRGSGAGSRPGAALASSSTLNRLELGVPEQAAAHRYKRIVSQPEALDDLLVGLFMESHAKAPREIWLDLDATDDPLHGDQEGRFFHGYYRCYCYLPLYIFCGGHLLCARLRPSDRDAAAGAVDELQPIVSQLRRHWPKTRIVIRGDAGFCRDAIMSWCEEHDVDYVLGLARKRPPGARLGLRVARGSYGAWRTGKPARRYRLLRLSHAQVVEPYAARSGQGGASVEGGEPALRGDQSGAPQGVRQASV